MNGFDSVEEALEELRNGKIILERMIRTEKMKEILSVQQSLPQQKILILWLPMERDLSVCQCLRNM